MGRRRTSASAPATSPARHEGNGKCLSPAESGVVILSRPAALAVLRRLFADGCPPADPELARAKASMREQLGIDPYATKF